MKVHVLVALLTLVSLTYSQDKPSIRIAGTAINTTDPDQPIAAPIEIVVDRGECPLTVFSCCLYRFRRLHYQKLSSKDGAD